MCFACLASTNVEQLQDGMVSNRRGSNQFQCGMHGEAHVKLMLWCRRITEESYAQFEAMLNSAMKGSGDSQPRALVKGKNTVRSIHSTFSEAKDPPSHQVAAPHQEFTGVCLLS